MLKVEHDKSNLKAELEKLLSVEKMHQQTGQAKLEI